MSAPKRLVACLSLLLVLAAESLPAQEPELSFNWAFVKRGQKGDPDLIDFSGRVRIGSKDLFKIFIQPLSQAYIYLYLQDAQNELFLLFPESMEDFADRFYKGRKYYIPNGDNWFTLDETKGVERFHLLVSPERLPKLESLTEDYLNLQASGKSSEAALSTAKQQVLDEITRIRQEHSRLKVIAEKPVPIAGGVRGQNAAVEELATQILAQDFYTKTFRLEH